MRPLTTRYRRRLAAVWSIQAAVIVWNLIRPSFAAMAVPMLALDVYKRQGKHRVHPVQQSIHRAGLGHEIAHTQLPGLGENLIGTCLLYTSQIP